MHKVCSYHAFFDPAGNSRQPHFSLVESTSLVERKARFWRRRRRRGFEAGRRPGHVRPQVPSPGAQSRPQLSLVTHGWAFYPSIDGDRGTEVRQLKPTSLALEEKRSHWHLTCCTLNMCSRISPPQARSGRGSVLFVLATYGSM